MSVVFTCSNDGLQAAVFSPEPLCTCSRAVHPQHRGRNPNPPMSLHVLLKMCNSPWKSQHSQFGLVATAKNDMTEGTSHFETGVVRKKAWAKLLPNTFLKTQPSWSDSQSTWEARESREGGQEVPMREICLFRWHSHIINHINRPKTIYDSSGIWF